MQSRSDAPYKIKQRVSVDAARRTFSVQWADENALGDVTYPDDTIMVRRAYPWE